MLIVKQIFKLFTHEIISKKLMMSEEYDFRYWFYGEQKM